MKRSVWAVAAGFLAIVLLSTTADVVLHLLKVYPPMPQPIDDSLAILATSYRLVIGVWGAWLTARLAPEKPMKHALILGGIGLVVGLVSAAATWNMGLGPRWYPAALTVLALPQCWLGGKLHELRSAQS